MKPPLSSKSIRLTGGITRRHTLFGLAGLVAGAGFWSSPFTSRSFAQTLPAEPAIPSLTPEALAFLKFSRRLTGHGNLKPVTAARIEEAMRKTYPDFVSQFDQFAPLIERDQEPKTLLAAATDAGLRDLALAIVAAWYTGTIGKGKEAIVVSYAEALMYQPVSDGQTVPTYCNYGPLWWVKAPPPIRVSPPVASAAVSRPTVGTPEPKTKQS